MNDDKYPKTCDILRYSLNRKFRKSLKEILEAIKKLFTLCPLVARASVRTFVYKAWLWDRTVLMTRISAASATQSTVTSMNLKQAIAFLWNIIIYEECSKTVENLRKMNL